LTIASKRILVVDDYHVSREAVGKLLEDEGIESVSAADGHEALVHW